MPTPAPPWMKAMTDLTETKRRLREMLEKAKLPPVLVPDMDPTYDADTGQIDGWYLSGDLNGLCGDEPVSVYPRDHIELIAAVLNAAPAILDALDASEKLNERLKAALINWQAAHRSGNPSACASAYQDACAALEQKHDG